MTWFIFLIIFAAAIIRGYTGFGLSAILITIITYWMPAHDLVPMLILLEITSSLLFYRSVSLEVDWKQIGVIFIGAAISTPLALSALMILPTQVTHLIIASLVLLATVILLLKSRVSIKSSTATWLTTGLVMGVFAGLGSIGALAGMVMLLMTTMSPAKARATIIVLSFITSLYAALFSAFHGMMTSKVFIQWLYLLIPLIPGLYIGHLLFKNYQKSFRTITLILLAILSVTMMVQSVYQLSQQAPV